MTSKKPHHASGLERTDRPIKKTIKTRCWTDAQKEERRQLCLSNKPWESATGPRTDAGKAASSKNALRHGLYDATYRELSHSLLIQRDYLRRLLDRAGLNL